jgi:hypothetical protein
MSENATVTGEDTTPTEDGVIGSLYLVMALAFTLANLPCLYVMVHEKNLWKNSCIKVGARKGRHNERADDGQHGHPRPDQPHMPLVLRYLHNDSSSKQHAPLVERAYCQHLRVHVVVFIESCPEHARL